ncbi:MAG: fused MFS/spermidine synthase [Parvularculaceae bacterium]|nr:fused MFS/spermidine synthase [Parvularculaceae bacterium]
MSETLSDKRATRVIAARLVPVFVASIFTSAWLLFGVQPLFSKMALPVLGGAPNVWNTAMVFFQTALLLGYLYAHFLSTRFSVRTQALIHICTLMAGMFFLPFGLSADVAPPAEGAQAFWLIGLMAGTIGIPFFALSANAPLLQRWFSLSGHAQAHDPYFLYAASNIGSMASLLLYPFLLEPLIGVSDQTRFWTIGYIILAGLIALAANCVSDRRVDAPAQTVAAPNADVALTGPFWWTLIAIAPSGLMLSVTSHLTTNVAPTPMLWIAPLALYLLSFVLVFGADGDRWRRRAVAAFPFAVAITALADVFVVNDPFFSSLPPIALFFIVALACHGELARRRPEPARLTEFYLCMSLGGVIGGAYVALVAPLIFPDIFEYPLLVITAAFVIAASAKGLSMPKWGVAAFFGAAALIGLASGAAPDSASRIALAVNILLAFGGAFALCRIRSNAAVSAIVVFALFANAMAVRNEIQNGYRELIARERSFFGVTKVYRADTQDGPVHMLLHGAIIHNMQLKTDADETTPLAYFSEEGPFGQALEGMRKRKAALRVAVVGLGAGALACHASDGDDWTFYELDPHVVRIAKDANLFSYLERCAPDAPVKIGDARLTLTAESKAKAEAYDFLVIDAFSSDSIPAHLITREALTLYRDRLKEGGVIFFHTSNRYLDVVSVAVRLAEDAGLSYRVIRFDTDEALPLSPLKTKTLAVVMGDAAVINDIAAGREDWVEETPSSLISVWTDDFSNILGAFVAHMTGKTSSAQ